MTPGNRIAYWNAVEGVQYESGFSDLIEYEMTINGANGESNFIIKNIDLDDEARYWCDTSYFPTPPGGHPNHDFFVEVTSKSNRHVNAAMT